VAGYVIVDIDVFEPVEYERYKTLAHDTIGVYGGEYLARGGRTETVEGTWTPKRLVVLRFPSLARAKEWLASPEYAPALAIRRRVARSTMILVEGI
jgi:uncharacterized protein (DUF1330 family)